MPTQLPTTDAEPNFWWAKVARRKTVHLDGIEYEFKIQFVNNNNEFRIMMRKAQKGRRWNGAVFLDGGK